MKELLQSALGRGTGTAGGASAALGGIRLELPDEKFDQQPAVSLLPRALVLPFEALLEMLTASMTDTNRDLLVGLLADACCERVEHFVTQNTFGFAGALKMEECVRALGTVFSRASGPVGGGIRGKFGRLREIMLVLTSDSSSSATLAESSSLTHSEVTAFLGLRVDNA